MKFTTKATVTKELKDGRTTNIDFDFGLEMDIKEMSQMTLMCREDIATFVKFVKSGEFKQFVSDITNAEFTEKQLRVINQHNLEAQKENLRKMHKEEKESSIVLPDQIEAFVDSFSRLPSELKNEFFTRMGTSPLGSTQKEHKIQVYYLYKEHPDYAAEVLQELTFDTTELTN